jgi:tetratricopeptide (TPR) repeat protein
MKKLLTVLWIIIILGTIIISINIFKPKTSTTEIPETPIVTTEPIETPEPGIIQPQEITETEETYTESLNSGDKYLADGLIQKAIESYKTATTKNPNSTIPLLKLGEAYLLNNDPKNAEDTFKKAEILAPDSIEIKMAIARSYLNERNIEAAKALIWELPETDPTVKYYKAITLVLYKNFDEAKTKFQEIISALEIPPQILENSKKFMDSFTTFSYFKEGEEIFLQTLLAKSLIDVKEYEASIPLLYDIIDQKNNYRDAWIILGYAYLNTDKISDSIYAFTEAKDLDEEKPQTLFFLGLAYFANNEIEKATFYIEEADKNGFEPKDEIYIKLGEIYLIQENFEKSEENFAKVLSLNTNNIGVFIREIWLNIDKLNNPEKALEFAYLAVEKYPNDSMSYNLVGWALTATEDYSKAKIYLTKALEIKPEFDAAYLNLGWLYDKQGLTTLAKEHYKKAYTIGNGNSIANLAAQRFNNLTEKELNKYYQADISSP